MMRGRGKIPQRARADRTQEGGPGTRRAGQDLGDLLSSARIPVCCFQELGKMEGSRVGGRGKRDRGRGWTEMKRDRVAKKPVGAPRLRPQRGPS